MNDYFEVAQKLQRACSKACQALNQLAQVFQEMNHCQTFTIVTDFKNPAAFKKESMARSIQGQTMKILDIEAQCLDEVYEFFLYEEGILVYKGKTNARVSSGIIRAFQAPGPFPKQTLTLEWINDGTDLP